jgi:NAD(P)-dependent dehydrogenase (short-subunit alcohol dehydrogenase family)
MAIKFASAGARIVCADLRPDARPMATHKSPPTPTHELINETYKGDSAIFVQTDASDEEAIKALIARAVSWGGRLDSMRHES